MNTDEKSQQKAGGLHVKALWQEMLDAIPAAAYTCDAGGLITYFNPFAADLWGRAPKLRDAGDRYCGSHQMYLSDGTPIRHDQCWMALALLEGRAYIGREIVVERSDGSRVLGEAYAYPLRDDQNRIVGALNLVADITPRDTTAAEEAQPYSFVSKDAALSMIAIAAAALTAMKWTASAFS